MGHGGRFDGRCWWLSEAFHLEGGAVEQGPLDLFAGFEANGRGEGQRHINIQPRVAPLGADRLDGDWILDLHRNVKLVN